MVTNSLSLLRKIMFSLVLVGAVAGCAAVSGQETAGEYVDDATISTKVRAELINELGANSIGVETMKSVVQLSGFVDSATLKDRAGVIAYRVSGVRKVENDIIVE